MAKTSKIDLIEEFGEIQKENDVIILTTFKFDSPFFDIFLMDKILRNNPSAEIFILMDAREYEQSYESFTRHTGRKYHLIPVFCNKGVFHPKLSIFYSETNSIISAYIGSCNVTLAGFTSNAELITKIDSRIDPIDSTVDSVVRYFILLIENRHIVNNKLSNSLEDLRKNLKNHKQNTEVILMHNLERPILTQLLEQVDSPIEVTLLAPFWSSKTSIIQELNKDGNLKKINIILQENNHNLSNPETYKSYCKSNDIKINFLKAKFEKNRYFHSKIMKLISENTSTLVGSSNMTEYALLNDCRNGNFEASALLKSEIKEIIDEIRTTKIAKLETIKSKSLEFHKQEQRETIRIYSVDFNMISQTLSVILDKEDVETVLTIIFEDNSEKKIVITNQELIEINCEKIPFELLIKQGTKTAYRRIFYDSNYFYKKISKGIINLSDIDKRISHENYQINALDLLRILSGLNLTLQNTITHTEPKKEKLHNKKKEHFSLPSKEINSYNNRKIINNFIDLVKLINSKKQDEREMERSGILKENDQQKNSSKFHRIIEDDNEKRKLCIRIIKSINELLFFKAYESDNPCQEIVASKSIMIQSIIIILSPIYVDKEILDLFIEYLEENLENLDINVIPYEIRSNFFINLVLLNYFFEQMIHYSFFSNLFKIEEVMDSDFIHECLIQVTDQLIELRPGEEIDQLKIMQYAGFLCCGISDRYTVEKDLMKSLDIIKEFTEEINWEFGKAYLKTILTKWSLSNLKDQINDIMKDGNLEQKQFIKNLLVNK